MVYIYMFKKCLNMTINRGLAHGSGHQKGCILSIVIGGLSEIGWSAVTQDVNGYGT